MKRPPDIRKKIQTFTISENANTRAIYCSVSADRCSHSSVKCAYLENGRTEPRVGTSGGIRIVLRRPNIGDLGAGKSKEEKHGRPYKLSNKGHKV